MTGVVGALVALAVVVALVLVLAVRPHVRRLTRSVAVFRADTTAGLAQLRAIRARRPPRAPEVRDRGTDETGFRLDRRGLSPLAPHLRRALPPPLGAPDVTAGPTPRRRLRSD
jgi:hypothetical protein